MVEFEKNRKKKTVNAKSESLVERNNLKLSGIFYQIIFRTSTNFEGALRIF